LDFQEAVQLKIAHSAQEKPTIPNLAVVISLEMSLRLSFGWSEGLGIGRLEGT
jgi:hypothetical protein